MALSGKKRVRPADALPIAAVGRADRREVARFLREQPVPEIPRRSGPPQTPGLIALPLLGYRVIRRLD